ncbi:MAG: M20/M25/M40 family metallo-hydrolase [Armatimonadetes bacterium]|nr:M20/M25/M40 family metallo-hydrolase [Armatimonadota bacterium]
MISLFVAAAFGQSYLQSVKAADLRHFVTFLASDSMKGRQTPSPELDQAADYIARQFKEEGVLPGNIDSYFQIADWSRGAGTGQKVRNVIGVIPGSDPILAKQFVIVSAHYDHLGVKRGDAQPGEDVIYNGADDDASGVAGVLEIGKALAKERPRRTIVLMTFYGEEKGLVGSHYYVDHPVFPLKDTVANINVEQIGRTDDTEGPRVSAASLTGFSFSSIGTTFERIGKAMGVPVTGHPRYSAMYFGASDNLFFARAGVPAHTICTAFEFPDYHAVGDSADKLDYDNMAKVVRMTAATVLDVANSEARPTWNASEPAAKRYLEAAEKLAGAKGLASLGLALTR